MKKIGNFISLFCFLLINICLYGQNSFIVRAPQTVSPNEGFTISYTINAKQAKHFEIPTVTNGRIVSGPYSSKSSSTTIINGVVTSSSSITFSLTIEAQKIGTLIISPAKVVADNKSYTSKTIKIQVTNSSSYHNTQRGNRTNSYNNNTQRRKPNYSTSQSTKDIHLDNKTIFVRAIPSKTNVFKGEQVLITYKLYTLIPVTEYQIERIPSTLGFWVEELDNKINPKLSTELYNGQRYQVATLHSCIVYPQKAGKLNIDPMSLTIVGQVPIRSKAKFTTGDPFFDEFFSDDDFAFNIMSYQRIQKQIKTNNIELNVRDLPNTQSDNPSIVGDNFTLRLLSVDKKGKSFEPFYLTYQLCGKGNITLVNNLPLHLPEEFQVLEPEIIDSLTKTLSGVSGTRTFKYLVIPKVDGKFVVEDRAIQYFDLKSATYKNLKLKGFTIQIDKGKPNNAFRSQLDQRNKYASMDITVEQSLSLRSKEKHVFDSFWFYCLMAILLMIQIYIIVRMSKYRTLSANITLLKQQKASKEATRRLKKAKYLLLAGQMQEFEDEIANALWNYLLDKFAIDKSILSINATKEMLIQKGFDSQTVDLLGKVLDRGQYLRFSQDEQALADKTLYDDTQYLITYIEQQMRKNKKANKITNRNNVSQTFIVLIILFAGFGFNIVLGQNTDSTKTISQTKTYTLELANKYFNTHKLDSALMAYHVLSQNYPCATTYEGLGNTYYRMANYPMARWCYEKALKYSPNNKRIKQNCLIARAHLMGETYIMPKWFLPRVCYFISGALSITTWVIITIGLFVLCLVFVVGYLFSYDKKVRNFYLALWLLIFTIMSFCFGLKRQNIQNNNDYAIIYKAKPILYTSDSKTSKPLQNLYSGQKIKILHYLDGWIEIALEDNTIGYILDKDYKIL